MKIFSEDDIKNIKKELSSGRSLEDILEGHQDKAFFFIERYLEFIDDYGVYDVFVSEREARREYRFNKMSPMNITHKQYLSTGTFRQIKDKTLQYTSTDKKLHEQDIKYIYSRLRMRIL